MLNAQPAGTVIKMVDVYDTYKHDKCEKKSFKVLSVRSNVKVLASLPHEHDSLNRSM